MTWVVLAGAALAVVWWDWFFPGVFETWVREGHVYAYHTSRLLWGMLLTAAGILGLWWVGIASTGLRDLDFRGPRRSLKMDLPIWPAFAAPLFLTRYWVHPTGIQSGSSIWTYGLVTISAYVLAVLCFRIWVRYSWTFLRGRWPWVLCCVAVGLYLVVFGGLSFARHHVYRTHALDLGTMDQAVWNTLQGRILERTPLYRAPADGSRYENRLLDAKLELILIPFSGLYALWADPRVLLLVQTLFLAAGAIPLYRLVRMRTQSPGTALALTLAYLLYTPLHYVQMADFHPSALMIPLLLAAWCAMTLRHWRFYYLWLVLALCCRIDAAFCALALGVALAFQHREARWHGLWTVLLAVVWLVVDFWWVVPTVQSLYPGAGSLVSRRFGDLGTGPLDVLRTLVAQPRMVLRRLVNRDKVQALFDLLVPVGFTPFLAPVAFLPALPVLGINMLAESDWQHSVHAHYMAPVIPFVWIAAGEGIGWLTRTRPRPWGRMLALLILVNTLLVGWTLSPFPPGKAFRLADYVPGTYEQHLAAAVAQIPDGASVCAQSDLHPHLSQRRDAALFPRCQLFTGQEAEMVIVDLDPTSVKSPMDYHAFYELVEDWLAREDYGVVALQGSALLLRRGASRDNMTAIRARLEEYGNELYRATLTGGVSSSTMRAGTYTRLPVTVRNDGSQSWHSLGQLPVRLSYHWLDAQGQQVLSVPSVRTDLPHRLGPGDSVRLRAALLVPSEPGTYTLVWDVLREGDAWFGDRGGKTLEQQVDIQ